MAGGEAGGEADKLWLEATAGAGRPRQEAQGPGGTCGSEHAEWGADRRGSPRKRTEDSLSQFSCPAHHHNPCLLHGPRPSPSLSLCTAGRGGVDDKTKAASATVSEPICIWA